MGACTSKPNVLNGDAPEVAPENIAAQDVGFVVKKEEEAGIADADKSPSLDNLLNNEEGKGSVEEKEDTLIKASEVASEDTTVEKVVDDVLKTDATNFVDEKKIEEVESETSVEKNVEEVVKPSVESENKTHDPAEKTVEEVKPVEKPAATEDKKIEEKPVATEDPNSEAEKKKTEEKPAATKKGKFWWDK
ncbi:hypothetical protein HAX54_001811 [Datura stramonium]|uniref:Uncharacterized protein n=1 Tax=Datura stramonium TaxID=4076 RepID=A0ABS8T447_DATST|nr:hypothetical protein [Datura stramonium]